MQPLPEPRSEPVVESARVAEICVKTPMTKHDLLTDDEFQRFELNPRTLLYLERHAARLGRSPAEIRVLDWGCGRGRTVLALRERGWDAWGVDIDSEPVGNGRSLLRERGHPDDALRVLDGAGIAPYGDAAFDFVCSDQVFEHVSDLDAVAFEQRRLLAPDGAGFHQYPGHRYLVEGHLHMPLVHWLPKSSWLRRAAIRYFVRAGREPGWAMLEGRSVEEKAHAYYTYTVEHTFYRTYREVRRTFERQGFGVDFETIHHPGLADYPGLERAAHTPGLRSLLNHVLLTFKGVELLVHAREAAGG
jgi:SAM-dependent methyltransferase